jgi:hypothetical protein
MRSKLLNPQSKTYPPSGRKNQMSQHDTGNVHTLIAPPTADQYRPTAKDLLLFLVMARRDIRRTVQALASKRDDARQNRRKARVLKQRGGPFDAARIALLERLADDLSDGCKPLTENLKQRGLFLAGVAPLFDAGTTLVQRCEILGVSVADRDVLTEADGLHQIIFAHGLEDSASSRGEDWKNGPLFQALNQVFMDFLLNSEEGKRLGDSLFNSGGIFADVPMYTRAPDGTMTRQPPRLRFVPATTTDQGHA